MLQLNWCCSARCACHTVLGLRVPKFPEIYPIENSIKFPTFFNNIQSFQRFAQWQVMKNRECRIELIRAGCHENSGLCMCVRLHSCSCEVKFVQERGVARLWEVARFNLVARCGVLLPRNLIKTYMCVCMCVCVCLVSAVVRTGMTRCSASG